MEKRRFDTTCKTGWIRCNKLRFQSAALILYRPHAGLVRVAFGTGDNLTEEDCWERDEKGNRINDYLYITMYGGSPEEGVWTMPTIGSLGDAPRKTGLLFEETDGAQMLYSRKSWPRGDLREMLPEALEFIGWPKDVKGYYVLGYEGAFWDRPDPTRCPANCRLFGNKEPK